MPTSPRIAKAFVCDDLDFYFSPGPESDGDLIERGIAFRADPTTLGDLLKQALAEPKGPGEIRRALVNAGYVVEADWVVSEFVKAAVAR